MGITEVDIIIIVLLCVLMIIAFGYIGHSKKRGKGCIGCPDAPNCAKRFTEQACKDDYK